MSVILKAERERIAHEAAEIAKEIVDLGPPSGTEIPRLDLLRKKLDALKVAAEAVSLVSFGPQGGETEYNYNYHTWSGYHPPGFGEGQS